MDRKYFVVVLFSFLLICASPVFADEEINIEGNLIPIIVDSRSNDAHDQIHYFLRTKDAKAYKIKFAKEPKHPERVKRIKLKGKKKGSEIFVESYIDTSKKLQLKNATSAEASGNQRTLVVPLKNPYYSSGFLYSSSQLEDLFFSKSKISVQSYYDEVSRSKISFSGDVTSTLQMTDVCASETLFDRGDHWFYVLDAIVGANDLSKYDRLSIVVPNDFSCFEAGLLGLGTLGKVGLETFDGDIYNISFNFVKAYRESGTNDNTFVSIAAHEFGHNLGLKHDNGNSCGKSIFTSNCPSIEYAGVHSIMGFTANLASVNAIHQEDLGWFSSNDMILVNSDGEQIITIAPMAAKDSNLPKAIKIARGDGSYYLIEYRKPINIEANKAFSQTMNYQGFLVYLRDDGLINNSILLRADLADLRPSLTYSYNSSSGTYNNSSMALSFSTLSNFTNSFYDDVNHIKVSIQESSDSSITLKVTKGEAFLNPEDDFLGSLTFTTSSYVEAHAYAPMSLRSSASVDKQLFDSIDNVQWDFDGDSVYDSQTDYAYTSFYYDDIGTFTPKALVTLTSGKSIELEANAVTVTQNFVYDLTPPKSSISSEPVLNYTKPTKMKLKITSMMAGIPFDTVQITNSNFSYLVKFPKNLILVKGKSITIPVVIYSELDVDNVLNTNAEGYYEIPLNLRVKYKGYKYKTLYTITLKVKSSRAN